MPTPLNLQGRLRKMQANFASDPAQSHGRLHNEKKSSSAIVEKPPVSKKALDSKKTSEAKKTTKAKKTTEAKKTTTVSTKSKKDK